MAVKSGGAGSGYIGNSLLSNKKMVGFNVPTSSAEATKTESVNVFSASAEANKPKAGNGFARIKFLRRPSVNVSIDIEASNQLKYNNTSPTFRIGSIGTYDSVSQSYSFSNDADWNYNNLTVTKQNLMSATKITFECEAKRTSSAYGSYADIEFYFHGVEAGGDIIECIAANGNNESTPRVAIKGTNGTSRWNAQAPLDMGDYIGDFHKVKYELLMSSGKVLSVNLYVDNTLLSSYNFNIDLDFSTNNNYTAYFGAISDSYIRNYKITIIGGV